MRHLGIRRLAPLAACSLLLLTACGGAGEANPEKIGPRGVDELVIPTPDPDPADFVEGVDNPWLPLEAGTVWTYQVSGSAMEELVVRVEDEPKVVSGISCVVVHGTGTDSEGEEVLQSDAYYAQDDRGNVWLFGEETRGMVRDLWFLSRFWSADESGAEAGLAMPASPRLGDGYARALSTTATDRSTVVSLDQERTLPAGVFGDLLLVEDQLNYPYEGEPLVRRTYAEGVGLVQETRGGGLGSFVLASVTPGSQPAG